MLTQSQDIYSGGMGLELCLDFMFSGYAVKGCNAETLSDESFDYLNEWSSQSADCSKNV